MLLSCLLWRPFFYFHKLKKDFTDRFAEACAKRGESQASVITRMMEDYIAETNAQGEDRTD